MKICVVQKCPSTSNYAKLLGLDIGEVFNLSSQKVPRLLKRDIDISGFSPSDWDWVILVGSEAVKEYSKCTAVSDHTGRTVEGKKGETNLIACISPAMLSFKPELAPVFEATKTNIQKIVQGNVAGAVKADIRPITDYNEALEYVRWLRSNATIFGLDSETTDLEMRNGEVLGISLSHKVHQGVYIHVDCIVDEVSYLIQCCIEEIPVVLHNAKFDMKWFKYHFGWDFDKAKQVHDTMIQHYLLDERQGTHGLKSLTLKYGTLGDYDKGLEEFKESYCKAHGIKKEDFSYGVIPWDIIWPYAALDTAATLELHFKFLPLIENNPKLKKCYYELMIPALMFLTRMEYRGIPVSVPRLTAARKYLEKHLTEAKQKLYEHPEVKRFSETEGKLFNPNSPLQIRSLLFDYVGLDPTGKLTGTGAISTDAEVLQELANLHEVPKYILEARKYGKLISTYVDKLIPVVSKASTVHTGFNLTSTTSGRLSSSGSFNVQQLPRDNPIIKGCVKAKPGYKIVAVDLTTAEVYYAAVLSGDKNMQQVFINMKDEPEKYPDFHSNIAHMVFHLPCEPAEVKKLHPALRQGAKAITFGILYGSGPAKVAESVNEALMEQGLSPTCTIEEAKGYISTYFGRFPRLKRWIDECHNEIKTNGYIYNHFGRKRRLHNIRSSDRGIVAGEIRSGFNAIIQSVSSDHLLLGALEADLEIIDKNIDANIFALVHDSVVAEIREDQVTEYLEILYRCIQKDRGCSIPGYPIGVDQDTEEGGSVDYSGKKLAKEYPELAAI